MKNEHMSYHLKLLRRLEVSMWRRGGFVIVRNMIRQMCEFKYMMQLSPGNQDITARLFSPWQSL